MDKTFALLLLVFLLNFAPVQANQDPQNVIPQNPCAAELLVDGSEAALLEKMAKTMKEQCPKDKSCSTAELIEKAVKLLKTEHVQKRSWLRYLLWLPMRGLHIAFTNAGMITPGLLLLLLFKWVPEDHRQLIGLVLGANIGNMFFGRFSYPYSMPIESWMEQMSYKWWGSPAEFHQINATIMDTQKLANSYIYNQKITSRESLNNLAESLKKWERLGPEADKKGSLKQIALWLTNTVLDSEELFAGLFLDSPSVIREVRSKIPHSLANFDPSLNDLRRRLELIRDLMPVLSTHIHTMPKDEISPKLNRQEIVEFTAVTLLVWIFGKDTVTGEEFQELRSKM